MSQNKNAIAPVIERYEFKYLISSCQLQPISDFLLNYCSLDEYSKQQPSNDFFYQVNSLYFDSPGFELFNQNLWGKTERFNLRVRSYGDQPALYYLECKHRTGIPNVVNKTRCKIPSQHWPAALHDTQDRLMAQERQELQSLQYLLFSYALEPKILTQYQRRAFSSDVDDYARVTLDCNLKYCLQDSFDFNTQELLNYDHQGLFSELQEDQANVVLELKCKIGATPVWMLDLVRRFELKQIAFSKYVNSTRSAFFENHESSLFERMEVF